MVLPDSLATVSLVAPLRPLCVCVCVCYRACAFEHFGVFWVVELF